MDPIYTAVIVGPNKIIVFGPNEEGTPPPNERMQYSTQRIHPDDTIETIKRKILVELPAVSYDELYLYATVQPFLTVERTIRMLTCGHRFPISHNRLITMCQNLKSPHIAEQLCESIGSSEKTEYTAEELSEFLQSIQASNGLRMDTPLGQELQYDYPMLANPFEPMQDPFLKKAHHNLVTTKNKSVLLEYGIIHNNIIYVCCASDVLNAMNADPDADARGSSADAEIIKLYYPFLNEKGIVSREGLAEERQNLLDETRPHIDDAFRKHNSSVDVLYQVYAGRQQPDELRYAERGIKSVHFIMRPITRFAMPLDSLFKVLHSAQSTPLIKYNPQGQREKVYRMHAPNVAKNGNRIPALTKSKIMRLDGEIGKRRRVAAYMEYYHNGFLCEVVCEFDAEANVHVKAHFRQAMQYGDAYDNVTDHVLRACLNPLLDDARGFLFGTSGHSIELFCSIAVPTVEIVDIGYAAYLIDTPMIHAQGIMGCMSGVFTVVDETDAELSMRYKRVSNYDERFGAEAYIAERIRKETTVNRIVDGLIKNRLVKNEAAAMERIADYRTAEQVMESAHRNTRTRVKQPGFLTIIRRENMELHIEISDITSVWYIRLLEIYLDAIIRIALYRDRKGERTTSVPMPVLENLCSKRSTRKITEVNELNDAVAEGGAVPAFVADLSFEDRIALERALEREAEGLGSEAIPGENEFGGMADMLELMMQGNEEEEGDEEEGEGSENEQLGGAPKKTAPASESDSDSELSVGTGSDGGSDYAPQSLKNPNPFEHKLQKSEPILFLSKKTGNYDTYSTNCQSNIKRQPVVLSKREYDELHDDPEMRPMLKDALEYGSDPDNKYYYMCPRYWSFKDRRPMTEQEVADKHLERHIIGKKEKEVTRDKYIFEFNDYGKEHMGSKGYIQHYPGFLNASVHPDGLCVPCCFKKKQKFEDLKVCEDKLRTAKGQVPPAKEPEMPDMIDIPVMPPPAMPPPAMPPIKAPDDYIVGPDKFPIPMGRRGYLPQSVQRFLNYDNRTCQVSQTNKTLKKNVKCLLRHGVQEWDKDAMGRDEKPSQLSELQSFIACMAAMRQDSHPKSIPEMKHIILDGITLDSFLTYQNGTLVDAFKPAPGQEKEVLASASIHSKSKYVQKMKASAKGKGEKTQERINAAMSNTINAYENFRKFIASNDTVIDHTYMWDIFTTFNPKIFNAQKVGFNLIILEIPKDDNSDALNIVCPSNHYSDNFFDVHKMTVILIKQYNYYEPIFQFTDNDNAKKSDIKKSFSITAPTLMPNLKVMIELIKDSILPGCAPVSTKPYPFKYNISASNAMSILNKHNIIVYRLVLNYDSKVIGLAAEKRNADRLYSGIVMTAASPLDPDLHSELELVMMDDPDIWSAYEDTMQFLAFVSKETKAKIPCLPRVQVIDDGRLIGILTETNQFMEIQPSIAQHMIPPLPAGLKQLDVIAYNTNPNAADADVQSGAGEDAVRVKYVQRIHLETEMYELFRNSMRIMINKIKNIDSKKRLEDIIHNTQGGDTDGAYQSKIREIVRICLEMSAQFIQFTIMSDAVLKAFIDGHQFKSSSSAFMRCISADSRIEYGPNTCMRTVPSVGEEPCRIIFPHKNLINGIDNRTFYYGKLADELLRYTRIRRFIMSSSSTFTSFMPVNYDLHDDEIILMHSQLEYYFDHLEPGAGTMNRFVQYNTFDTANPELNPGEVPSSKYVAATGPALEVMEETGTGNVCVPVAIKLLTRSAVQYFPKTMKLLTFENASGSECTFEAFISIMKEERAEYANVTVRELKAILVTKYDALMRAHKVQMMKYYQHITANRNVLVTNVQDFIMNSFHYMTHLDLWILAQHFRIPIVLFSGQMQYPLIENQHQALVLYCDPGKDDTTAVFYYVMTMGRNRDVAPTYSIVRTGANEMKFSLSQCTGADFVAQIVNQIMVVGIVTVTEFIAGYVPTVKKRIGLKAVAE
jgi:hypothetical protein